MHGGTARSCRGLASWRRFHCVDEHALFYEHNAGCGGLSWVVGGHHGCGSMQPAGECGHLEARPRQARQAAETTADRRHPRGSAPSARPGFSISPLQLRGRIPGAKCMDLWYQFAQASGARSRNLNDLQMRELVMVFIRPRRAPPLLGCRSSL